MAREALAPDVFSLRLSCSAWPAPSRVPPGALSDPPAECPRAPAQPPLFGSFLVHVSPWPLLPVRLPPGNGLQESSPFPPFPPSLGRLRFQPRSLLGSENGCWLSRPLDLAEPPAGVSVPDLLFLSSPSLLSGRKRASEVLSLNHFSLFLIYLFLIGG